LDQTKPPTLRSLLLIDKTLGDMLVIPRILFEQSPNAQLVKEANLQALLDLYKEPKRLPNHLRENNVPPARYDVLRTGTPHIAYIIHPVETQPEAPKQERIADISKYYFVPDINGVILKKGITSGDVIRKITPRAFLPENEDETLQNYGVDTPIGLLMRIGMGGDPIIRGILEFLNRQHGLLQAERDLKTAIMDNELRLEDYFHHN
jgi:hypothetical protein